MIFGIDNSSSRHSKNVCNNFLLLSEGSTDGIDKVAEPKKKSLVLILLNQKQNFL